MADGPEVFETKFERLFLQTRMARSSDKNDENADNIRQNTYKNNIFEKLIRKKEKLELAR